MYLERINSPKDIKCMTKSELTALCAEIRQALIEKLSIRGGHFGPNMGDVELIVAMHYVFDSPKDKIVYDVSHQSYVHKILTGRKAAFTDSDKYNDVTGFSNPHESEHDFFTIGHTSTSVSLACGLAKARDLKGENNNVIAVIGDGSLSGGEAFEGLDNAAEQGTNMIVVVNDNEMSIAENHGGLYRNLEALRKSNGECECNFFKAMGFEYIYVENGNDVESLITALKAVKDYAHPIVVHVHTLKGKGYAPAEQNRESWHYCPPFDIETGNSKYSQDGEDYSELTYQFLKEKMQNDNTVVAVSAATPTILGFTEERRKEAGKQFVDVGIAEEHAVALISGIAKNGGTPVFGVYGTFISRSYDQIAQDLCINKNPATILVFLSSVYGMNDVTHLGIFDIPMMSNIPNLVYLAPTSKEEYFSMLEWSMRQKFYPVAIRVPSNGVLSDGIADDTDYNKLNKYKVMKNGNTVAIIALGSFYNLGVEVAEEIFKATDVQPTLINPKFITGVDSELLENIISDHKVVITLEDGILEGGFGEKIARFYGCTNMKVLNYGIKKSFPDGFVVSELMKENRLTPQQITEDLQRILN